jgi:bifunctional non-homologous end joining protein LigD
MVMKRFPNGVAEKPFYQHRVEDVPSGVRMAPVGSDDGREQIIGGDLLTLLYTAQLAAISQDPWFSRVSTLDQADFVALDLDPSPGVSFARVCSVALWIRDELGRLKVPNCVKTSGSEGMHIYIPLPPGTPYDTGLLFAQIMATLVTERHPKEATIERSVRSRGTRVYVDYLQNIQGKTLACAYSARASAYAGVSAPLTWTEVERGVKREDFTIETMPARVREVGDLWKPLRDAKGVDLAAIVRAVSATTSRTRRADRSHS